MGKRETTKDNSVKARISIKVKSDLQEIAESYGMSLSGLIAYILGQWVHQQKVVLAPMLQEIGQTVNQTVASSLGKQIELEEIIKS